MEYPTYRLEGVVRSREELEDFEGPLNLILMLLSKNKIEIRDIRISDILDQYLEQIAHMQEMNIEIACEFVQMASYLLYIKTRTILAGEEEISELEVLMSTLEQMKNRDAAAGIRTIVPELKKASEQGLMMFTTPGEAAPQYGEYDYQHESWELMNALARVFGHSALKEEPEQMPEFVAPRPEPYSVRKKCAQLIEMLRASGTLSLHGILASGKTRSEVVAVFLSVLELCSLGSLRLEPGDDGCMVSFTGGDTEKLLESITD